MSEQEGTREPEAPTGPQTGDDVAEEPGYAEREAGEESPPTGGGVEEEA